MKQVDFYLISNQVADGKHKFASRLSNKLQKLKKRILIVTDNTAASQQLDQTMWSFSDTSFVAHDHIKRPNKVANSVHVAEASVLNNAPSDSPLLDTPYDVVINLCSEVHQFNHHFNRVVEIVEPNESDKVQARTRFKIYKSEGFELNTHSIEL